MTHDLQKGPPPPAWLDLETLLPPVPPPPRRVPAATCLTWVRKSQELIESEDGSRQLRVSWRPDPVTAIGAVQRPRSGIAIDTRSGERYRVLVEDNRCLIEMTVMVPVRQPTP